MNISRIHQSFVVCVVTLLMSVTSQAEIFCQYDGDDVDVYVDGQSFSYSANDGWIGNCESSEKLAAFYDGDNFIVFDAIKMSFTYYSADDLVEPAVVSVYSTVAAMYDGDNFIVYDQNRGAFIYQSVDDNMFFSLEAGKNIAAMYDGDDLYVYDQKKKSFSYKGVDDNYLNFKLIVGDEILLAYDGDDVFYYCGGEFKYTSATDNAVATGKSAPWSEQIGLRIDGDLFVLSKEDCSIKTF